MQTQHVFGRLNTDDADKDLNSTQIRHAKNLTPIKRGDSLSRSKVKSNRLIENSVLNAYAKSVLGNVSQATIDTFYEDFKCIGRFENNANEDVFFFYKNPDFIIKYSVSLAEYQLIADGSLVDFYDISRIYDISIVDEYLFWNISGVGQFYIDLSGNTDYSSFTVSNIKLQKLPPITPVRVAEFYDENGLLTPDDADREYTKDKAIKFTYRFIFKDNTVSTFAPLSKPIVASKADPIYFNSESAYKNQLPVYYGLSTDDLYDINSIKSIDLVVVNINGTYSVFKNIDSSVSIGSFFGLSFLGRSNYLGNETLITVSEDEAFKIQEANPTQPKSSVAFNDRIFQAGGFTGRDNSELSSITLTPSDEVVTISNQNYNRTPLFKPNGQYQYGVQFYDENHKRTFVQNQKIYEFPSNEDEVTQDRYLLKLSTGGSVPSWAKYFQFCISSIQNVDAYFQCPTFVLYNVLDEVGPDGVLTNEFVWKNAVYLDKPLDIRDTEYSYAHLVLPQNIPFEVTTDYKVRIRTNDRNGTDRVITKDVLEVRGNILIVTPFDSFGALGPINELIEVYKPSIEYDEIIYETGDTYPISEWGDTFDIFGDTYYFDGSNLNSINWQFERINIEGGSINDLVGTSGDGYILDDNGKGTFNFRDQALEIKTISQTNTTLKNTGVRTVEVGQDSFLLEQRGNIALNIATSLGLFEVKPRLLSRITETQSLLTLDYKKALDSKGRINTKNESSIRSELKNTIYFSDPKIQESTVNGLSSFNFQNNYTLPSERGPITQLVPVNDSVLLCFHPRNLTTLYIGEGFIRQGNDSILAKTEGVVGDDRLLQGNYGTVNPESVVNYKGTVFFWDKYARDVVRYNNNGATPLGLVYKMKNYFEKWGELLKNSDLEVIGGFDVFYGMYVLTFPAIGDQPSETVGFRELTNSENKGFVTFLDYQGQCYSTFGENFVSLNKNKTYIHDGTGNTLYGNDYSAELEFVHNEIAPTEKIYDNIIINSNVPWNVELTNRRGQLTDLMDDELEWKDETFYGDFLRDKNTPEDQMDSGEVGLLHGNIIKDQLATIKLSVLTDEDVYIDDVGVGFTIAAGHNNKAKK